MGNSLGVKGESYQYAETETEVGLVFSALAWRRTANAILSARRTARGDRKKALPFDDSTLAERGEQIHV